MGITDFFTDEAGQRRRAWLDRQDAKLSEAFRYYLGPTGIPERAGAAAQAAAMLSPGADVQDAYTASGDLVRARTPLEAATAGAGLAGSLASLFLPGNYETARRSVEDLIDAGVDAHKSGALFMFAGPRARTADHAALAKAQEMESTGADADTIWRQTGWGKGTDGNWRFEIDDRASRLSDAATAPGAASDVGMKHGQLPEVLEHPELYAAYPELSNVEFWTTDLGRGMRGAVMQEPGVGATMWINPAARDPHGATLHETQHVVQGFEGWSSGADAGRIGREDYRGAAGEVEARNTEARSTWPGSVRRQLPPWVTEDTPRPRQK